ncbi:unnamed protein product [Mucor hiemalis]
MSSYEQNLDYDYSNYDYIFGIDFGSTLTKVAYHSFANEVIYHNFISYPSVCQYSRLDGKYDKPRFENWGEQAIFEGWGEQAKSCKNSSRKGIYVSKLCDKVEKLSQKEECDHTAKDRVYITAIIDYFKALVREFKSIAGEKSRNRYVMTYSTNWGPKEVAYLRSLVQRAGVINEQDHPDRLLMYSEGASALRALQTTDYAGIIKQGYRYMVCDIGRSKVKMSIYDIIEPLDTRVDTKGERFCEWDVNYMNEESTLVMNTKSFRQEMPLVKGKHVEEKRYNRIMRYVVNILKGSVGESIEALVVAGGSDFMYYMPEMMRDNCHIMGTKAVRLPHCEYGIVLGAIYKAMDGFIPRADAPKIVLDRLELSKDSIDSKIPKAFVFIDYGLKETTVSYIYSQPGQPPNHANTKHINDWPGQSALDHKFPTVDIMLIPGNKLDRNRNIISLKENSDHVHHLLKTK